MPIDKELTIKRAANGYLLSWPSEYPSTTTETLISKTFAELVGQLYEKLVDSRGPKTIMIEPHTAADSETEKAAASNLAETITERTNELANPHPTDAQAALDQLSKAPPPRPNTSRLPPPQSIMAPTPHATTNPPVTPFPPVPIPESTAGEQLTNFFTYWRCEYQDKQVTAAQLVQLCREHSVLGSIAGTHHTERGAQVQMGKFLTRHAKLGTSWAAPNNCCYRINKTIGKKNIACYQLLFLNKAEALPRPASAAPSPKQRRRRLGYAKAQQAANMKALKVPIDKIAEALDVSVAAINRLFDGNSYIGKIKKPPTPSTQRLSYETIRDIREEHEDKELHWAIIAEKYGIPWKRLCNILEYESYRGAK